MKKILNILLLGTVLGCLMSHEAEAVDFTALTQGLRILGNDMSGAGWNIGRVGQGLSSLGWGIRQTKDGAFYLARELGIGGITKGGTSAVGAGANVAGATAGKIDFSTAVRLTNGDVSKMGELAKTVEAANAAKEATQNMAASGVERVATQPIEDTLLETGMAKMGEEAFIEGAGDTLKVTGSEAAQETAKKVAEESAKKAAEEAAKKGAEEGAKKGAEETAKEGLVDKIKDIMFEQTVSWNYGQYAVQIGQALVAKDTDDATKEVKVKGADPMGGSQGSPNSSSGTQTIPEVNSPISGSTVIESVNALLTLIQLNPIDISLLSKTVERNNTKTLSPLTMGSSGSQAGLDIIRQGATDGNQSSYTAYEKREIFNRRKLLLAEWAAAATQIGEGSNAISSAFYERAKTFIDAASASNGSIGGVSTINDSDRFVLFELTRGALLSAVQLGLQSSVTLSELEVVPPTTTPAQGAVSLPGNQSQ